MNRFQLCLVVTLAALALAVGAVPTSRENSDLCKCRPISSPKIIGGSIVQDGVTYPWMASLGRLSADFKNATKKRKELLHQCGAIILNKDFVLTTARCFEALNTFLARKPHLNISSFGVGFGKSLDAIYEAGRIPITEAHVHPKFKDENFKLLEQLYPANYFYCMLGNFEYDFAVLKLSRSLHLSSEHGLLPACLETMNTSYYYEPLSTIGYGGEYVNRMDAAMLKKQNYNTSNMAGNELRKLNMQQLLINTSDLTKFLDAECDKKQARDMFSKMGLDRNMFSEQMMHSWKEMIMATAAFDEPVPSSIREYGSPLMYQKDGITKVVGIASDTIYRINGTIPTTRDDRTFFAKIYTALPWIRDIVHDDLCLV